MKRALRREDTFGVSNAIQLSWAPNLKTNHHIREEYRFVGVGPCPATWVWPYACQSRPVLCSL